MRRSLTELSIEVENISLERPANLSYGDYSSNVAMVFAKQTGQSPKGLAEKLLQKLNENKLPQVSRIETAGPGFVNFYLSKDFFLEAILKILGEEKKWGENKNLSKQKIIIEYTQPNPFKEFHLGHLVNNIIGEAISRLIEAQGAKVKRVTYHGDVGLHVAKAIWAMEAHKLDPNKLSEWGRAYSLGERAYRDSEIKGEIDEINIKIYEKSDQEINKLYEKGRGLSLRNFKEVWERLGSSFDESFFESQTGEVGKALVEKNIPKNIFEKSEQAIIFPGERYGLHTRVFVNSQGLPTYEAKDLGLLKLKEKFFNFDKSIAITDIEQAEYYKVVMKAAELVFPELKGKIEHLS
ncbi:MAG: Arginine-tRNA ligase, partial [Parcubacteria group bacterium Gr01-1014_107]